MCIFYKIWHKENKWLQKLLLIVLAVLFSLHCKCFKKGVRRKWKGSMSKAHHWWSDTPWAEAQGIKTHHPPHKYLKNQKNPNIAYFVCRIFAKMNIIRLAWYLPDGSWLMAQGCLGARPGPRAAARALSHPSHSRVVFSLSQEKNIRKQFFLKTGSAAEVGPKRVVGCRGGRRYVKGSGDSLTWKYKSF